MKGKKRESRKERRENKEERYEEMYVSPVTRWGTEQLGGVPKTK